MRSIVVGMIAVVAMFGASAASAEQLTLRCTQSFSELYEDHPTQGIMNEESRQDDVTMVLDLETSEFNIGNTRGKFRVHGQSIIGMARQDPLSGVWDIDRTTGRMMVIGHVIMNESLVFVRNEGQCTGPNGAVPF